MNKLYKKYNKYLYIPSDITIEEEPFEALSIEEIKDRFFNYDRYKDNDFLQFLIYDRICSQLKFLKYLDDKGLLNERMV